MSNEQDNRQEVSGLQQTTAGLLDFYSIVVEEIKPGKYEIRPEFYVRPSKDLMVRGGEFYAVWDETANLWNTSIHFIESIIDNQLFDKKEELRKNPEYKNAKLSTKYLRTFSTGQWKKFQDYVKSLPDNFKQLDEKLTFQDTKVKKSDHVSKRLSYSLNDGDRSAYEELISTLYEPNERAKIEWAIGSIIAGESKTIQKFLVFYGPKGSGKSTILNIVEDLFGGYIDEDNGYCSKFDAKGLMNGNDQFVLEAFKNNSVVAIDHDTNLSRIEDNSLMNKIVSHEMIRINEKFVKRYGVRPGCFLMMGTNSPVKITDAKSGIIRRLIDVEPSGRKIRPESHYDELKERVKFELGAIAKHCLDVFHEMGGRAAYSDYEPRRMMYRTDPIFNFMEDSLDRIEHNNGGATANEIWAWYQTWCTNSNVDNKRKRYELLDEVKNYFSDFQKITRIDGKQVRSWYSGFKVDKFIEKGKDGDPDQAHIVIEPDEGDIPNKGKSWLVLDSEKSLLDDILAECPAQYEVTTEDGKTRPDVSWSKVRTKLKDIDTHKIHYVKVPGNLIVIDFDLKDSEGNKDAKRNLEAAGSSQWPPTYAEYSKSGCGIHLHYWYDGDVNKLSRLFDENIEIKVFPDDKLSTLRRKLSKCNDLPVAHISSGLPLKEEKVINKKAVEDNKHLHALIMKAVRKEIEPYSTKTSIDFIDHILKEAQAQNVNYDVSDLSDVIYAFAANSSNNSKYCIDKYYSMELVWPKPEPEESGPEFVDSVREEDAPIIILDTECYPNLFLVVWKELGPEHRCFRLFNPKPNDIENLMNMRIIGFNNTGYDDFMLWGCYCGFSNQEMFNLSQSIIGGNRYPFKGIRNVSYADVYDFSSEKKSLKKFEIDMHLPHKEMDLDWSKPAPESEWERIADYCENDVRATEAVFLSKERQADFKAREILADLTGLPISESTNHHTAQLIFGDDPEPQSQFNYPDLKKEFPEYRYENGKSYFLDEVIGEGGRVYAQPGMYANVFTFDVASMHPTSIIVEQGFGPVYTKHFQELYEARIAIKHGDFETAKKLFGGKLAKYLDDPEQASLLSYALKIALNSVYGMTAASFKNRFKDPRNIDNWVAKRGALFMEKLRRTVQAMGAQVVHIKTDSIKIVNPSEEIKKFVIDFGKEHGYTFEIESIYERMCLVNNAVYIAKRADDDPSWVKECKKAKEKGEPEPTKWTATGAQFAHPFVFKKLFSKEKLDFYDFCETKTVKTAMYLDFNEKLGEDEHNYYFIGKAGMFCPVKPGSDGGLLYRKSSDDKYGYVTGAKGYRWIESEVLQSVPNWRDKIDLRYFKDLIDTAIDTIAKFGDFEMFVSSTAFSNTSVEENKDPEPPCKTERYFDCTECPFFSDDNWGYCYKLGTSIEEFL